MIRSFLPQGGACGAANLLGPIFLAACMVAPVRAADNRTVTVSLAAPTASYTAGPFVNSAPGFRAGVQTCAANAQGGCDTTVLNVNLPTGDNPLKVVRIEIAWPNSSEDFDLYVSSSTTCFDQVAVSNGANRPEVVRIKAAAGNKTYRVCVISHTAAGGSITGNIALLDDSDGDGIEDAADQCPGTPDGIAVDATGCPPTGGCITASAATAAAAVPLYGPTTVDADVRSDWARIGETGLYGAFVQFYRQGSRLEQTDVLRLLGLSITHDFRRYTNSVFVEGPVWAFRRLETHPWIMRIEHNTPLRYLDATQSWTTRVRMAQEVVAGGPYFDANGKRLTGEGVTLGIMDSGMFGAHPDFAGRIAHNFKYAAAGYADVGYADSENGAGGHGTHVSGIVAGDGTQSNGGYPVPAVAPFLPGTFTSASPKSQIIHWGHGAGILVVNIAAAYQHLLDNIGTPKFRTLRAVNNSYGDAAGTAYNANSTNSKLIKRIVGCNVNMVFAAGNSGGDGSADMTSSYCKDPTPGVICVASYNDQGTGALDAPLSTFSSRGKQGLPAQYPDIAAPGDLSTSTCAQATPTQAICTGGDDEAAETEWQPWYGTISGTSMASPNITGVIGTLVQAKPELTAAEIEQLMQRTARKVGGGYEDDPQHPGSTTHFGYGAGLVDIQSALNDLMTNGANITMAGPRPVDEEWTIFDGDAEPDVAEAAANAVKLTMQNHNEAGIPGVMFRLTVGNATQFISPSLAYRVEYNIRGAPAKTTILATPTAVTVSEPGESNTAVATFAVREGNVIRFFVPYSQMGFPQINEPIHNIRVIVENQSGAVDYAPSPANRPVQTAAVQPMFGRAFTTRLSPGTIPPSSERACELPGVTRVISPPGLTGNGTATGHDDLRRIYFAEPGNMPGKLVVTIKMANLSPAPIPDYRWYMYFNTPVRTNVEAQLIAMDTVAPGGSTAAPGFKRGYRSTINNPAAPVGSFTLEGDLPGSLYKTDGTIQLVMDKAQFGLTTGMTVTGIAGSIRQTSNAQNGAGLTVDSGGALEGYTLVGNLLCPVLGNPVADLQADVTGGLAPLTVNFDASGSSVTDPDATLDSFTFDFGDGSSPVTQSTPTVQHTYTIDGTFTATVKVTDSNFLVSDLASVDIDVEGPNVAPVVNAGADFSVDEDFGVMLNGTATDANGDTLSYAWTQVDGPTVEITNADRASATFSAPAVDVRTPLTFRLTVSDGKAPSVSDDIIVSVRDVDLIPVSGITKILGGGLGGMSLLVLGLAAGLSRRRVP